ncbi:MAG: twin-arginine translocation signal domain-containing protein [Chloroflexi bacterium]|nr:twin-arginine translocation signal domain-containing protein [Chloroflexota bacterium]
MNKLTRRQFLKWAGAAGLVTLLTIGGYRLYRQVKGEQPPHLSPYVASELTSEIRPGLPILILVDEQAANPFGIYLAEILRAEGLNCFQVTPSLPYRRICWRPLI